MAGVKFHLVTQSSKLNTIPIQTGNLIFDEEARCIYLDNANSERIAYQQIIVIKTEAERQQMRFPIHGAFYFVEETTALWRYTDTDEWVQVTNKPQIVFDSIEDFPVVGDLETLYVAQNQIYRYYSGSYHLCANDSVWETV